MSKMPGNEQDRLLLEQLKAGDSSAFTTLYNTHRKWLAITAMTILEDEEEVQDLIQDFFIDFWSNQRFCQIGPPYNIRAYLHLSIRNRCFDKVRRKKVRQKRMERISMIYEPLYLPEDRLANQELRLQLNNAIDQVPPMSAQVFRLTYLEQKSRNEIASQMGISPNTVRNQLVRAVKILRQRLQNI
jgi:RNA polymerase sigma-70 factor (family 1)